MSSSSSLTTTPQRQRDDDEDVTLIDFLSSDAGSIVVDCFTLADYQRLLCTSQRLHDVMVYHKNNNDNMTTKDFLREREILWLFNRKRHDPLTKRMFDCIRSGNYHVEVIRSKFDPPEALTLAEMFSLYKVRKKAINHYEFAKMSDKYCVEFKEEDGETKWPETSWGRTTRGPTKKCVSQFCQGDGNPSRLYIIDEDRLYCDNRKQTSGAALFAKWEGNNDDDGDSSIVKFFACGFDSKIYFKFVGGHNHEQLLKQAQEQAVKAMRNRARQAQEQAFQAFRNRARTLAAAPPTY